MIVVARRNHRLVLPAIMRLRVEVTAAFVRLEPTAPLVNPRALLAQLDIIANLRGFPQHYANLDTTLFQMPLYAPNVQMEQQRMHTIQPASRALVMLFISPFLR